MGKDVKIIFTLIGLALLGYFIKLGTSVFIARHISVALYGDFNLALKILNVFVTITMFGSNFGASRFLSKYLKLNQEQEASRYIAWNAKLLSVTFLISFIVSLIAFIIMSLLHTTDMQKLDEYHMVVYTLWLFPFATIGTVMFSYLESSNQVALSAFFKKFLKYLTQLILFAAIIFLVDPLLQVSSLITVLFLAYVIIGSISVFSMNTRLANIVMPSLKKIRDTNIRESRGKWIKTNARLTVNSMAFTFICAADMVLIELLVSDERALGYYSAAMMISGILFSLSMGIFRIIKPVISTLLHKKETHQELQHRLNANNLATFITLSCVAAFIIIFEKNILLIFGPDYLNAEWVVTILVLSSIITCFGSRSSVVLVLGGYEHIVIYLTMLELFMSLVIIGFFTYFFGIIGTAFASGIIGTIKLMINIYLFRKKLNLRLLWLV